jgi:hypothetical protein
VRPGDRVGDRETEPGGVVRARVVRAREAIERVREELGGEAAAFVAHTELDTPVPPHGRPARTTPSP